MIDVNRDDFNILNSSNNTETESFTLDYSESSEKIGKITLIIC